MTDIIVPRRLREKAVHIKGFGWKRDLPDARDRRFSLPKLPTAALPRHVNLSSGFPPVYDQGDLGSCTGNAISAAVAFDRRKLKESPDFIPSRLFIYYNERVIEGTTSQDAGASIRDGFKSIATVGVCDEVLWPYLIDMFAVRPPAVAYAGATPHKAVDYGRVDQSLLAIKTCLAAGFPIVFGFSVYSSFEQAAAGFASVPGPNERLLGGHAVVCCGYNSHNLLMIRNSWGPNWGDPDFPGYFWMPPEYLTDPDLASDFWVVRTVSS